MTRNIKLRDGSEIKETDVGTYAVVFPNKRYIIITTWKGHPEIDIPTKGIITLE